MAKYTGGLLGEYSGKIGNLVASSWKGINYVRSFVIPANPQTSAQTAWRNVFQVVVLLARTLLSAVIQPYWDVQYKRNSGYAEFMKTNLDAMSGGPFDIADMLVAAGTWGAATISTAEYSGSDVTITWDTTTSINQKATDKIVAVVVDLSNSLSYVDESAVRSDGTVDVTVGAGWSSAVNRAFVFAVDETVEPIRVSTSSGMAIS